MGQGAIGEPTINKRGYPDHLGIDKIYQVLQARKLQELATHRLGDWEDQGAHDPSLCAPELEVGGV